MNISISLEGDKLVIENLNAMPRLVHLASNRGLKKVAIGVSRLSVDYLNNGGAKGTSTWKTSKKTGKEYLSWKKNDAPVSSGAYPVPTRTGHLKRLMFFLGADESKTVTYSDIKDRKQYSSEFKTGPNEVIVFNAAHYSRVIHEGLGSSAKFGRRPFLHDALQKFNAGDNIVHIVTREIEKGLSR